LIADITPPELRGQAFGFNKAMDKIGGFLGLIGRPPAISPPATKTAKSST
jgi:hypothetical protein